MAFRLDAAWLGKVAVFLDITADQYASPESFIDELRIAAWEARLFADRLEKSAVTVEAGELLPPHAAS